MKNKMSEQEKIDKEGMHEAAQAFRCIQNAKCKAEVFSFFVANIRNGDCIDSAIIGAMAEWDEL